MAWADLVTIAPLVGAILVAGAIILADIIRPGDRTSALVVSFVGLAIVAALTVQTGGTTANAFGGAYRVDALTTFLDLLFISIAALTILFAPDYLEPRGLPV